MPSPRLSLSRLIQIVMLTAATVGCAMAFSVARAAASPLSTVGVYVGGGNTSGLSSFAHSLGGQPSYVTDFLPGASWGDIEDPDWYVGQWSGTGSQVVLSVPMLPSSGATLATGATGAYNSYFQVLAQHLLADGDGSGIVRLGWEFNGNWFPWTIANGNAANYAAYWRQIVTTMRTVAPNLRFDWCANGGSSSDSSGLLDPEAAYPGDQYVNYIGMDQYDQSYVSNPSSLAVRWNAWVNQPYGLAWQRSFAAAHDKQVSFPEWGLDTGGGGYDGGDDPGFIQDMYNWFQSSNLAYESYFNFDTGTEDHSLSDFPNSQALYSSLFSSSPSTATATAPSTTPAPSTPTSVSPAPAPAASAAPTLTATVTPAPATVRPAPTSSASAAATTTTTTTASSSTPSATTTGARHAGQAHRDDKALARSHRELVLRWSAHRRVMLKRGKVVLGSHAGHGSLSLSHVRRGSYRACLAASPRVCSAAHVVR